MKEKIKIKRIYLMALSAFLILNIFAVFFVFGNYRSKNHENNLISKTKIKYSKLKEKIEVLNERLADQTDSFYTNQLKSLNIEEFEIDSMLNHSEFTASKLHDISSKIEDLNHKSDKIFNEINTTTL